MLMEPSPSSGVKPKEVQLERSQELRTRVTNNVLYILRGRVGMTQAKALINVWGLGYADHPDLIITRSIHVASIFKYDYCVSQKFRGMKMDRAWKSEFAWSVYLDLCHRQKVINPVPFFIWKADRTMKSLHFCALRCASYPCAMFCLSWGWLSCRRQKQLVLASGMPLLCASPCLPPLGATLPNVFVSKSPWHW